MAATNICTISSLLRESDGRYPIAPAHKAAYTRSSESSSGKTTTSVRGVSARIRAIISLWRARFRRFSATTTISGLISATYWQNHIRHSRQTAPILAYAVHLPTLYGSGDPGRPVLRQFSWCIAFEVHVELTPSVTMFRESRGGVIGGEDTVCLSLRAPHILVLLLPNAARKRATCAEHQSPSRIPSFT